MDNTNPLDADAPIPNAIDDVVHKDLEPGVINDQMLQKLIVEQGYQGEAGRLARNNPIVYENITVIRLEALNLLKIDHLWVLPNLEKLSLKFNKLDRIENIEMLTKLKDLDLSFNYIERIERLDQLVNLEILSLFRNRIRKLENLDTLERLLILSVGSNDIDTYSGIERLRFMKKLRSLNLEGNPIAQRLNKDVTFRIYIAAHLPILKYYNYVYIQDEEHEKGREVFRVELRHLEETQLAEVNERERIAREAADERRLSSSFVELLNEHQLFDSFWDGDVDGHLLISTGEEVDTLVKDYRMEIYALTQKIYKLGLLKHEARLNEITMFEKAINEAKLKAQESGIAIIDEFLMNKAKIFTVTKELFRSLKSDDATEELFAAIDVDLKNVDTDFNGMVDYTYQAVMEMEIQLFENIEEANTQFGLVIMEMLNEFIEQSQAMFVQMREAEGNFSDSIYETVSRFITQKAAVNDVEAIPEALRECLEDKDAIVNFIAGSRDFHIQVIDMREDLLVKRARAWAVDLIAKLQSDEINRNRSKVLEINYFLEMQRDAYNHLQEEVDAEED